MKTKYAIGDRVIAERREGTVFRILILNNLTGGTFPRYLVGFGDPEHPAQVKPYFEDELKPGEEPHPMHERAI